MSKQSPRASLHFCARMIGAISLFAGSHLAQVTPQPVGFPSIPPAWRNLPLYPEIPYTPGASVGPLGPIDSPLEDADYIAFASVFWSTVDNGGTDLSALESFRWTAPAIAALTQNPYQGMDPDYWGGGKLLFEALYQHRLAPQDPNGPKLVDELIESDRNIAIAFKHWSHYHQLSTQASLDPIAHQRHMDMLTEALSTAQRAEVRGIVHMDADLTVSDRLDLTVPDSWFPAGASTPPGSSGPGFSAGSIGVTTNIIEEVQMCIDEGKGKLEDFDLYKADTNPGFLGFGGKPGFDCDDFADALAFYLSKNKKGVTACTVRVTWTTNPGSSGGKAKSAHLVTKIKAGGKYWLVDAQDGKASGPHDEGTKMDATPILCFYDIKPGSVRTEQSDRDHGYRPWCEPAPWTDSPTIVKCFEKITGLSAKCFGAK